MLMLNYLVWLNVYYKKTIYVNVWVLKNLLIQDVKNFWKDYFILFNLFGSCIRAIQKNLRKVITFLKYILNDNDFEVP